MTSTELAKKTIVDSIVIRIETIESIIMGRHGYTSRPFGRAWLELVNEIAVSIVERGLENSISKDVLDALTEENHHTACHAARLVRYAQFQYE